MNSCGARFGQDIIVSGLEPDTMLFTMSGMVGGQITNRTGLTDRYSLVLTFAPGRPTTIANAAADPAAPPDIFTALQEQLGLKLVRTKTRVPVFVVDHIERPTEN